MKKLTVWFQAMKRNERKLPFKNKKKLIFFLLILVLLAASAGVVWSKKAKKSDASAKTQKTAVAERRSITSELSSSGTISPKDTYSITSLVEGEIISAEFEEGDQVEKGQVLYRIDVSSMESELNSANNALERAQESYQTAAEDYQEALSRFSGNTYKSTESGYIKTLYIKEGDKVSGNTKIADIYDDSKMKIRLPFLSGEAANIAVGSEVTLTLTETQEQLAGTVTSVSTMEETLTGGRLVRYVTIEAANPGGLSTEHSATAAIGEYVSSLEGRFTASVDTVMSADLDSSVDVEKMLVVEGDYLSPGTQIFKMESKSAEKLIRSYKDTMDKAQENLESSQTKLESTQDNYDNYTITAPISGQIITKNMKVGDNISKNTSGATTLAVIYDLSSYTFRMSVDELDVSKVSVGQTVEITADAVAGKTYTGKVTNVSLESSASNGVTNYPVTVTLDETEGLLPGMNVDGVIILEKADDVLAVPADALMRGNRVYVKDPSVKEEQNGVPAGFRSVEVETGLISDAYVEISSGLSEGDEVYVAESSAGSTEMTVMPEMMAEPAGGPPPGGGDHGEGGQGRGQGGSSGPR